MTRRADGHSPDLWFWDFPRPQCDDYNIIKLMRRFETPRKAATERAFRITSLRNAADLQAQLLADRLQACQSHQRCGSAACFVCFRKFRMAYTAMCLQFFKPRPDVQIMNLVREDWIRGPDKLFTISPQKLFNQLRQHLIRAGITPEAVKIVGGLHGDFRQPEGYWRIHLHLVVSDLTNPFERDLRERFYERTERVFRPMVMQTVNNCPKQFSYTIKSFWPPKVRGISSRSIAGEQRRIPEPHHSAYLMWLDQYGPTDLMFLYGVRRHGHRFRGLSL